MKLRNLYGHSYGRLDRSRYINALLQLFFDKVFVTCWLILDDQVDKITEKIQNNLKNIETELKEAHLSFLRYLKEGMYEHDLALNMKSVKSSILRWMANKFRRKAAVFGCIAGIQSLNIQINIYYYKFFTFIAGRCQTSHDLAHA